MEASERGEITSAEADAKLREVVESVVKGTVETGREMAVDDDADGVLGVRAREDNDEGGGGKRSREEPGR